ncbi:ATP/GTP-binding protein [Streptomyces longisporoflavus]|uniref:ATP/GTP-binding protein n=1 Tax=Streptomyces longisporoflavus TaxID=28044 RepID=A0ABW7R2H2_9ACTN
MDPAAPALTNLAFPTGPTAVAGTADVLRWLADYWFLFALVLAVAGGAGAYVVRRLAAAASQERMALEFTPARHFDPGHEEIFRRGVELTRACTALPWWAPRRAKSVRIRMRSDSHSPFAYRLEGPAGAERLLTTTPFGPGVRVAKAKPLKDTPRAHEVRAEFILRGNPVASLRDVPLQPDPLQPLVDAVGDLRADLGDVAEICVDLQRAPKWALRQRRWHLMHQARRSEQREAGRTARWMSRDSTRLDDSFIGQLRQLVTPGRDAGRGGGRLVMSAPPVRVDRSEALGKLAEDSHLVRVQILVRCASDIEGRAEARLARVQAGLDVFGGSARWAMKGLRIGPWRLGADRWPHRARFDLRWRTGQCLPPAANWLRIEELLGLLKPPTVWCRMPLLPVDLPTFVHGDPGLLLQGWYRTPDGRRRLVATRAEETLFEISVGKAGGGKTERAAAQAVGYAHAGGGLLFIDPHHDSWQRVAPFLAHQPIMDRIMRIDLRAKGRGPDPPVSSWNPIGMHHQDRQGYEVVEDVVDSFATAFGWDDANAPRAIAIFTEALTVLTAYNHLACRADRGADQATLFHVRALLTDTDFRNRMLTTLGNVLGEETRAWWHTTFPTFPPDAFNVLINPLSRLATNPISHAFLGQPQGAYNIRHAMDRQMIVWVSTAGNGPTDRLVVSLINRDLLRAGRSRADTNARDRVPFRGYFDELITLAGAGGDSIASMFEDFRKYKIQLHALTQLLSRLPTAVRQSLIQNASTLSTTRGSRAAITPITDEWGDRPSPAQVAGLDQYDHYSSFTVDGRPVGPVLIHGPHLEDVFAQQHRPHRSHIAALEQAADHNAHALPLHQLTATAAGQLQRVRNFLHARTPAATGAASLTETRDYQ